MTYLVKINYTKYVNENAEEGFQTRLDEPSGERGKTFWLTFSLWVSKISNHHWLQREQNKFKTIMKSKDTSKYYIGTIFYDDQRVKRA